MVILALLALYPLRNARASRLMMAGFTIAILGGTLGFGTAFDFHGALRAAALQERSNSTVAHHETPTPDEQRALNEARAQRQDELKAIPGQTAVERAGYLKSEPNNARQFKPVWPERKASRWSVLCRRDSNWTLKLAML